MNSVQLKMGLENGVLRNPTSIRHCAMCLITLPPGKILRCGGCLKRTYCSKQCQTADWKKKEEGSQGHKNWCKLACGEEDLDWEVRPIPGKGLGLIAKRVLPPKFRILVEGLRGPEHPAIMDLTPPGATLPQKIFLNNFGGGGPVECVALRLARVNHSCTPNASQIQDPTFNVKILFAEREIEAGEEICISYIPWTATGLDDGRLAARSARGLLKFKWGIQCDGDCVCRTGQHAELFTKAVKMDARITSLVSDGKTSLALCSLGILVDVQEALGSSLLTKQQTLCLGFQICMGLEKKKESALRRADGFIQPAYDILSSILHPKSEENLKYEAIIKNPMNFRTILAGLEMK